MSLCISDVRTRVLPKAGTIRPSVTADIAIGNRIPLIEIPSADPLGQSDYAARKLIFRLYGDIAQDFECFLEALTPIIHREALPIRALELRDKIRKKLAGEGNGEKSHQAPLPPYQKS